MAPIQSTIPAPNYSVSDEKAWWNQLDLDKMTKVASMLIVSAYATGVIAINTYLHELGIVDFSFAKPKLLLTGVVVLLSFVLLASAPFLLAWCISNRDACTVRRFPKLLTVLSFALIPLLLLLVASTALCRGANPGLGQITAWEVWELLRPTSRYTKSLAAIVIALEVYLPILIAATTVYFAARILDHNELDTHPVGSGLRKLYLATASSILLLSVIAYIYIFTRTFYPAIPQVYGGGAPYYETFVIGDDDRCYLKQLGIPFETGMPNITRPLPVLHDTDELVAVWLKTPKDKKQGISSKPAWQSRFVVAELDKKQISGATVHLAGQSELDTLTPLPCEPKPASGAANTGN
jgi:hypothetical protein